MPRMLLVLAVASLWLATSVTASGRTAMAADNPPAITGDAAGENGATVSRGSVVPAPEAVVPTPVPTPIVTEHAGIFNGQPVRYTATVAPYEVLDADGEPGARLVAIDYVAAEIAGESVEPARRPVMFVFNGGPIAPSIYLHMGAFSPKRVAFSGDLEADPDEAVLVDNPYSILDVADLVYFDPAGTGFSRAAPGKDLEEYFSVEADAQQASAFVEAWLERHGRRDSPVYVFGESYGTMRAAAMAQHLAGLPEPILLDGVVLFGQAVNIIEYAQRPDNIISYVVSLPTLAALGWYHGKADRGGMDLAEFVEASWQYAGSEYLDALFAGKTLPAEDMARVAERLEAFTGLDAQYFIDRRLRVSKEAYRVALFADEGLVLGRSDGRYLGPADAGEEGQPAPDPSNVLSQVLQERFPAYLEASLGVEDVDAYLTQSPVQGLGGWEWGERSPFARFAYGEPISALMEKNPHARVLVGAGYYDTMTTTGASRYLVDQSDWPRERVRLEYYVGGHMAYSDEDTARRLAADLRQLMEGN